MNLNYRHWEDGGTMITNFNSEQYQTYADAVNKYNALHGEVLLVLSDKAFDSNGVKLVEGSSLHHYKAPLASDLSDFWKLLQNTASSYMKRLTAEDLFALKHGDKVWLRDGDTVRPFRYVGRMPSSERYLIFSEGEILKHLYVDWKGDFKGEWFSGEYDVKFIIRLEIADLEKRIQELKDELTNRK